MTDILVVGDTTNGKLASATAELITAAGNIVGDIGVGLVGTSLQEAARAANSIGARTIYTMEDHKLDGPSIYPKVDAFSQLCQQLEPRVILVSKNSHGLDFGPRLAFSLSAGLAQDCIRVGEDDETGRVVATRPVYGGSAMATVTFSGDGPQVVVLREKSYEPASHDSLESGNLVQVEVNLGSSEDQVKSVREVGSQTKGVRLEDAEFVIAGGRGLGGPEPFGTLEELASLLGGAVGASRAACDAGWVNHNYQVGLTGRTISPNVYLTVGISGASQHMAGCSGSRNIIAINKDREANIFKEARFGVVGDWNAILPSFLETVRELV